MSSQREMSGGFPEMEDILRSASAEGSFGAGKLNEQREAGRAFFERGSACRSELCSKFSRNSSVMGKRYVRKAGYGYFSEEPCRTDAHNEGGTALTSPFTHYSVRGVFM